MTGTHLRPGGPDWGWEFACERFVFARLDEERAAATTDARRGQVDALRMMAAWHSCYVNEDGESWARCFTCEAANGFPCTTLCCLAMLWKTHPDFRTFWDQYGPDRNSGFLADVIEHGGFGNAWLAKNPDARKEA